MKTANLEGGFVKQLRKTDQSYLLLQAKKMLKKIIFVAFFIFCQVCSNKICKDCSNTGNEVIDWSLNDLDQDDPKLIQILQEKYLTIRTSYYLL